MDFHINCSCAALAGLFHLLRSTFQTIPESDERNLQTREDDVANAAQQSIRARGYTIYLHVYLSQEQKGKNKICARRLGEALRSHQRPGRYENSLKYDQNSAQTNELCQ